MAQLIRTNINLTAGGRSGVSKPQGTLYYETDSKYYVSDSGPSSPYAVGTHTAAARSTTSTVYTSNGTWNNPLYSGENISMVLVFLLGGGGGGARGLTTSNSGTLTPRGGGGGGASIMIYPAIALGAVYPVTIGAGGIGGTSVTLSGTSGGTTSFGHLPGNTSALMGGPAWFGSLYAGGGSGGSASLPGDPLLPGGNGLYVGSPVCATIANRHSIWYAGPSGGRGGGVQITLGGGIGGYGMSNSETTGAVIVEGTSGTTGATGTPGGNGSSLDIGIMRAGAAGGGGGAGSVGNGGAGGNGGRGAGGGGGGSVTGTSTGVPGNGGAGGAGYAIVVSW